ncbi:MAG: hypothetical protein ACLRSW_02370 [Christensenellaceae bacterium]
MKLMDFDGLFDEKLSQYMEENKGKYTEKQWENIIPRLYQKFGDTYVAKVKCTPKEYYARMTDEELTATLSAHLKEQIPVPDFLCCEIEGRNCTEALLSLLKSDDGETVSYAINLVGADERAFPNYFSMITENKFDEDIRDAAVEKLKENADKATEAALKFYKEGTAKEYMLEILSRAKKRDEGFFVFCSTNFCLMSGGTHACGVPRGIRRRKGSAVSDEEDRGSKHRLCGVSGAKIRDRGARRRI